MIISAGVKGYYVQCIQSTSFGYFVYRSSQIFCCNIFLGLPFPGIDKTGSFSSVVRLPRTSNFLCQLFFNLIYPILGKILHVSLGIVYLYLFIVGIMISNFNIIL